ncbi:SNF2-related protein [Schaalia sp. Marseille-Q2122]|uniref:SNF2-related protein n=1 Tax=Schaalia sp. Marseille-Q2122 TaxID=2736604 RepID=UPI001C37CF5E|nr:SNF2-related protein [Schaalia sp. Marseille-Q2122]
MLTDYQAKFYAHELARSHASDHVGKLAGLLFDAQVEPKPHQIDAALFALKSTSLPGVILADEVGLGKTIEAGIVICQYWAERKRRILIIAPSSLRQQWKQELDEKFAIPAALLEGSNAAELLAHQPVISSPPGGTSAQVFICSYEFALRNKATLSRDWDLVIMDEAHRLRAHWKGTSKIAHAVHEICQHATKTLMLTATPLQNRLEELYGLVSVFDPDFFGSKEAFRAQYVDRGGLSTLDNLAARISLLAKRTLRRDASTYIRFTERTPITIGFTPSAEEQRLYELVNAYLQRPALWAFTSSQRHLSSMILRKRLGSSTYAIASTLEGIADRLQAEIYGDASTLTASERTFDGDTDADLTAEEREHLDNSANPTPSPTATADAALPSADLVSPDEEIRELRQYAALARSITVNAKATALIAALEQGFAKLREIGAPEKAIIFTDSTRTQDYIAQALADAGYTDGIVLFNGHNTSPDATRIYQQWLEENAGSDLITGVATADRRKALVDEFRERGTIMIATEAAAEGINLQFCSMLVNYDLPWNPQRVEQRIGRVHRFGQKHNVVVVNFSNKGNVAEERILTLLTEKFKLFTDVFDASDEVLGSIEDGMDFEKSINQILSSCTSAEEISAAFDDLEREYAEQISSAMSETRAKVFGNLDPAVRDKLRNYDEQAGQVLNSFERLLLALTQHRLAPYASFTHGGAHFALHTAPCPDAPTGRYFFKTHPEKGAHQYRFSSPLAQWVVSSAQQQETPPAELVFSLSASERATEALRPFVGTGGVLRVDEVSFQVSLEGNNVTESYLLAAGHNDEGIALDGELVRSLMDLHCRAVEPLSGPCHVESAVLDAQQEALREEFENRTAGYYLEQELLQDARIADIRAEYDARLLALKKNIEEHDRATRSAANARDRLQSMKKKRDLDAKYRALEEECRHKLEQAKEHSLDFLSLAEASLTTEPKRQHLFTIRWRLEN